MLKATLMTPVLLGLITLSCDQQSGREADQTALQPGGFSHAEEELLQQAEALKYAIEQIELQQRQLESVRIAPHETGTEQKH